MGKHEYEQEKCIGWAGVYARVCPSFAMELLDGSDPKMTGLKIDLGKSLFCQQREEVCIRNCLRLTEEYELAVLDKEDFILREFDVKYQQLFLLPPQ